MEKINIAELLKDCPSGMELDCTIYNGKVCFEGIDDRNPACPLIKISVNLVHIERLDRWGQYSTREYAKCVIFPKGKTTWEGFVPPCEFKDGDVMFGCNSACFYITIYKSNRCRNSFNYYACLTSLGRFKIDSFADKQNLRHATEEEKKKLFSAIKDNGYKWNAETKTLEKLIEPKFKVGDKIVKKNSVCAPILITKVSDEFYYSNTESSVGVLPISDQDDYELVPNKFDITTLVPFESRVLVREEKQSVWRPAFYGFFHQDTKLFYTTGLGIWLMCIPYNDDTKHLTGTTNDCEEFYKTWE